MNSYIVKINNVDYTQYCISPPKWSNDLSQQLDEGYITLTQAPVEIFEPLSLVEFNYSNGTTTSTIYFCVSGDNAEETPIGSGKYNHNIALIEETKKLEGFICDSISFNNALGINYTDGASFIKADLLKPNDLYPNPNIYKSPILFGQNTLQLYNSLEMASEYISSRLDLRAWRDTGTTIVVNGTTYQNPASTIYITPPYGVFTVVYNFNLQAVSTQGSVAVITNTATYTIYATQNVEPLPNWNIATVIDRVLKVVEPLIVGEQPRFILDSVDRAKLEKIPSPEFAFTKSTLREILTSIGSVKGVHAIPRVKRVGEQLYITFDYLGGNQMSALYTNNTPYVNKIVRQTIEDYAVNVDTTVDNIVNVIEQSNTVVDPTQGLYRTVRTDNAFGRIEDTNIMASTNYPIRETTQVKCGFLRGGVYTTVDITSYVLEYAEYQRLESFTTVFPLSKSYAIYYTQGTNNLYGINYKVENAVSPVFSTYAIVNILRAVTGDSTLKLSGEELTQLYFSISYIPIFSQRIKQYKGISNTSYPRALSFNQTDNVVESSFYGEMLKGTISRMGNRAIEYTFLLEDINQIPIIGELYGPDYYIYSVNVELLPTCIKCTVALSKNFNALSQYVGISSTKRYYEVSEKQAYRRDIVLEDFVIASSTAPSTPSNAMMDAINTLPYYAYMFNRDTTYNREPIIGVISRGYDSSNNPLTPVALPVVSTPFGNSVTLSFKYEDSFSAGKSSIEQQLGAVTGRFNQDIGYCDAYGRISTLNIHFATTQYPRNPATLIDVANALPKSDKIAYVFTLNNEENRYVIDKNSTEIPFISYQLNHVTFENNIIIGSALSTNNPILRVISNQYPVKLYAMPEPLKKFDNVLDLTNAELKAILNKDNVIIENENIKITANVTSATGKAWALVDSETNELLIGQNINTTNEFVLYLSIQHKLGG